MPMIILFLPYIQNRFNSPCLKSIQKLQNIISFKNKLINFIQTTDMKEQQQQSPTQQINSPTRTSTHPQTMKSLLNTNTSTNPTAFTSRSSLTQQQILSHPTIRQIFDKSRQKTIQHHVNIIPVQTKLYNVPLEPITDGFDTIMDSIPPVDQNYVSSSSKKIREFHERLSDWRDMGDRLSVIAEKNKEKCRVQKRSRPASAGGNEDKRVSISGLVSYNFNSVKARRSLGSIPDMPEQQALLIKKNEMKRKNTCSQTRNKHIIHRKPTPQSLQKLETQKAIVCNFDMPTDKFLHHLIAQSKINKEIYGQKFQKLQCIKQYMEEEQVDYEHAGFIVDAVANAQVKIKKENVKKEKVKIDDDVLLAKRRTNYASKRVIMKHLYFVE